MNHPRHDDRIVSHGIYADGFAIGSFDHQRYVYYFRWYDENYTVPCSRIHAESHHPFGLLAPIEDVRAAAVTH